MIHHVLKIKKGIFSSNGYKPMEIKYDNEKFYYYANREDNNNKFDKELKRFIKRLKRGLGARENK